MIQTVEALIDEDGAVRLLEAVRLPSARRALVTILDEPAAEGALLQIETIERLHPIAPEKPRPRFGSGKGAIIMRDDFDAPLEDFSDYLE